MNLDPNIHFKNDTALKHACKFGNLEMVKSLIERGTDIQGNYEIALKISFENGHVDVLKYLIEKGQDIYTYYDIPLTLKSEIHNFNMIKYLIVENNHDVNIVLNSEVVPKEIKDWVLNYKNVKDLNDKLDTDLNNQAGIIIERKYSMDDFMQRDILDRALYNASYSEDFDTIKKVLELGANIHYLDDVAIKQCMEYGNLEIVKYLADHGADVSAGDNEPVKAAAIGNYVEIVKYLIVEHGIDPLIIIDFEYTKPELKEWTIKYKGLKDLNTDLEQNLNSNRMANVKVKI